MAWRAWFEVLEDARAAAAAAAAADAARKERIRQREMAKRKQLGFEPRIGLEVRAKKRPIGHRFYDPNKMYDAVIEDVDDDTGTMTVRYLDEGKRGIVDDDLSAEWLESRSQNQVLLAGSTSALAVTTASTAANHDGKLRATVSRPASETAGPSISNTVTSPGRVTMDMQTLEARLGEVYKADPDEERFWQSKEAAVQRRQRIARTARKLILASK